MASRLLRGNKSTSKQQKQVSRSVVVAVGGPKQRVCEEKTGLERLVFSFCWFSFYSYRYESAADADGWILILKPLMNAVIVLTQTSL